MLRLPGKSHRSPCGPRQRKAPGRVFHCVTPSASSPRSHISQTPTRKTAEMNEAAKTPSSPGAWQHEPKIKSTQHKKCGSIEKLLLKGRSWSHHLSSSCWSPQSLPWLMTSTSTQTLPHTTWVIPKAPSPSASHSITHHLSQRPPSMLLHLLCTSCPTNLQALPVTISANTSISSLQSSGFPSCPGSWPPSKATLSSADSQVWV